jgi:hypothetical protein
MIDTSRSPFNHPIIYNERFRQLNPTHDGGLMMEHVFSRRRFLISLGCGMAGAAMASCNLEPPVEDERVYDPRSGLVRWIFSDFVGYTGQMPFGFFDGEKVMNPVLGIETPWAARRGTDAFLGGPSGMSVAGVIIPFLSGPGIYVSRVSRNTSESCSFGWGSIAWLVKPGGNNVIRVTHYDDKIRVGNLPAGYCIHIRGDFGFDLVDDINANRTAHVNGTFDVPIIWNG